MNTTMKETAMPHRDPGIWQQLTAFLSNAWPHVYAAMMAFIVSMASGPQAGGGPFKSMLEAVLCGCLTLARVPVLDYFGSSQSLAVAIGAGIAFLGTEWIRERAEMAIESRLSRWTK